MRIILASLLATLVSSVSAFAQTKLPMPVIITPIPTLSEWGVVAMVGALGVIGAIVLRKRFASNAE